MDIQRLPGFRDFYPDRLRVRRHLFDAFRETARRFGFEEFDGPPLEPLDLLTRKSGEEIVGQLYAFTDKGGREVALRPEMTPTLARMVAAKLASLRRPLRWFAIPQLFRYERQQRGRLREHFQLNMDILGEDDEAADAELIAAAIDVLRRLGLTADDVVVRVSDRRLLRALLLGAGVVDGQLDAVYAIVDKIERTAPEKTAARLAEAGLAPDVVGAVLGLPWEGDALAAGLEAARPLERCLAAVRAMGLGDFVRTDLRIVRGLAYYTGIVFEVFDRGGALRAIAGGGRYDDLLRLVGGEALPALGFGMGDVVLGELLEEKGLLPDVGPSVDVFLVAVDDAGRGEIPALAMELRDAGLSVIYELHARAVGKQFKAADAAGARVAVVLGGEEAARGTVRVKILGDGTEREIARSSITATLTG